jgi:hypothetical protein
MPRFRRTWPVVTAAAAAAVWDLALTPGAATAADPGPSAPGEHGFCDIAPKPVTINGSQASNPGEINFTLVCTRMQHVVSYTFTNTLAKFCADPVNDAAGGHAITSDQYGFLSDVFYVGGCRPGRFSLTAVPASGESVIAYALMVESRSTEN